MAIDTKAKRASVAGLAIPFLLGIVPDAAQPQGWRHAAGWSYYGIDAAEPIGVFEPVPITPICVRPALSAVVRPALAPACVRPSVPGEI